MVIPVKYRKSAEGTINYNFQDIESGVGMVTFYGVRNIADDTLLLVENPIEAGVIYTGTNTPTSSCLTKWNTDGNLTFDTEEFKIRRTLKGYAYVSFPMAGIDGAGVTLSGIKLVKVKTDTTTTDLTSSITLGKVDLGGHDFNSSLIVKFSLINPTIIKKGEKIRLSLTAACDTQAVLIHNPSGSSVLWSAVSGSITCTKTQLALNLPFVVPI